MNPKNYAFAILTTSGLMAFVGCGEASSLDASSASSALADAVCSDPNHVPLSGLSLQCTYRPRVATSDVLFEDAEIDTLTNTVTCRYVAHCTRSPIPREILVGGERCARDTDGFVIGPETNPGVSSIVRCNVLIGASNFGFNSFGGLVRVKAAPQPLMPGSTVQAQCGGPLSQVPGFRQGLADRLVRQCNSVTVERDQLACCMLPDSAWPEGTRATACTTPNDG